MEFRSGDEVVHPNYGVGSIVRLEEKQLAEAGTRLYYVLAFGKTTVWMPVNHQSVCLASGHGPARPRSLSRLVEKPPD
jgi:RNA polymerase-interacting CarD/CdnL/TRCF family regulator